MATRGQAQKKTLVEDARAAARGCIGMHLRLAERLATRFLDAQLGAAGLSFAQFSLMTQIAAARDDTVGSLAERLGLDQSTLSRNLHALERAGLAEIVIAEKDMRRRAVWLTEKGARRLEAAMPLWRRAQGELSARVSRQSVEKLSRRMTRLVAG